MHLADPNFNKKVLPQKVQDIFIGILLGDAYAERRTQRGNTRIQFKQSIKHADYLYWIYFQLLFWGYVSPKIPVPRKTGDNKGNSHLFLKFNTKTMASLNMFHQMFYPNGVKIVPKNIAHYLTPRALAYWVMDDGGRAGAGFLIHTNSFTLYEVNLLINTLLNNFELKAHPRKKYSKWLIYIPASEMNCLRILVDTYIHSSMKYKLGLECIN
jgi:ubiquinol-cytochrome c reductase cytochrome b subunit